MIGRRFSDQCAGLGLVDHQEIGQREQFRPQTARRGRVEQGDRAPSPGGREGGPNRLDRDLHHRHHQRGRLDRLAGGVPGRDLAVGAGRQGDAVLTLVVDRDEGHPRGSSGYLVDVVDPDPFPRQLGEAVAAELVPADCSNHVHRGPQAGRGDGLVGPLAAAENLQRGFGQYGFARQRQARELQHQVGVDASDHRNRAIRPVIGIQSGALRGNCFLNDNSLWQSGSGFRTPKSDRPGGVKPVRR